MTDKAKILVVDDEPQIVSILKEFLSLKGFLVTGALSAEKALEILANESFDCVLLDIMMPGMKGTEAAKIIKNKYPSIKVIVLTGFLNYADSLKKDKLLEAVFKKPFSLQELANKLAVIINSKQPAATDLKQKGKIQARILIIKAKLLFIEPSAEVFNFLNKYFKGLSGQGKDYELNIASDESSIAEKLPYFNPDLFVVNASQFKEYNKILQEILGKSSSPKEIIVYNVSDMKDMFSGVTLSTSNYDSLLIGWSALTNLQSDLTFDGGNSKFSAAAKSARDYLIATKNWAITDGGAE